MRSRSRPISTKHEEAVINLTPLLDVIFVILVIFMVVAPMLNIEQIELASSVSSSGHSTPGADKSAIQIHVHSDNRLVINKQPVTFAQLPIILKELRARFPDAKPLIFHDRKAQFGTYQQLKGELEEAGFDEMQLVLRPS